MSATKISQQEMQQQIVELQKQLSALHKKLDVRPVAAAIPAFTEDDRTFLVWALGFVAGSNLDRNGERGERIFAWCRELQGKLLEKRQAMPTSEVNPS